MKKIFGVLGILGLFGSGVYGAWWLTNRYDLPKDSACLWIEKADIDGDGKEETVSLSIEEEKQTWGRKRGPVIRILKWQDNSSVLLGKIDLQDPTGFIVGNVDKDGKDEIIISFCKEAGSPTEKMEGWVEVWGWNGNSVTREYESPDLFGFTNEEYPSGILLGLTIADTDNDTFKEIAVGKTVPNQVNMEQTENNFNPDDNKWGNIVGPLTEASIVRLEYNSPGSYTKTENSIGAGLVYRLTQGPSNKITSDVFDLNYTNVNTFMASVKTFIDNCDYLYPKKTLDILEKKLEQSEALKGLFTKISPINRLKVYSKVKGSLEKAKKKAKKKVAVMASKAKSKYYKDRTEKPLSDIPNIPGPLFETKIKVFYGTSYNQSQSIGLINLATKISSDKILVKPIDLDYANINSYINTLNLRDSLLYVKEEEHDDSIDQYRGTYSSTGTDYYPEPKELPQIPGRFLFANLQCFGSNANFLWKTDNFGPFNPDLVIDGDKAVVGIVDIDTAKLNTIISHLDSELKKWRQDKDVYEIQIPNIPDGLIYSKVFRYNISNGSKAYESADLGIFLLGLDKTQSIGAARTRFDWTRLNNFITEMNAYNQGYEARYKIWRENYYKPYFEKRARVIAHQNVASLMWYCWKNHKPSPWGSITTEPILWREDVDNDGNTDTYTYFQVFKDRGLIATITSVSEDVNGNGKLDSWINWPSWPGNYPSWDGPELKGEGIISANLVVLDNGNISWESQRLGDLSAFVKNQNTGITTSAYDFDNGICSIILFTPSTSTRASVYGKVLDTSYNPIFATKTDVFAIQAGNIKGSSSVGSNGGYQIILDPGTYTLVAETDGPYLAQTKTVSLLAGESKEVNFILIPLKVSVSGKVMDKKGNPIKDANVSALSNTGGVSTDNNGTYKITNLDPGLYKVSAWKEGYSRVTYDIKLFGDLSGIDFYLSKGGRISGVIYDKDGNSVPQATVTVWGEFGWGVATSTNSGSYIIDNLSSGLYELFAEKEGSGFAYLSNILVEPEKTTYINIYLKPTGRIEGRVNMQGLPLDREYVVVAFEDISLNVDNLWDVLNKPAGVADVNISTGSFEMDISSGIYNLYLYEVVEKGGQKTLSKKKRSVRIQSTDSEFYITFIGKGCNIAVQEGTITDCGTITAILGTCSISGIVSTDDGGSIGNDSVVCIINKKGELESLALITPQTGKYKMADIDAGVYTFIAISSGYLPYLKFGLNIVGTENLNVTLTKEGGTIKGIVTSGAYSLIARVSIKGMGIERTQITGNDGKYEFSGLIAGIYTVSANAPGYNKKEENVVLKGYERVILDFSLTKEENLSSISGGVLAGGNPIQGAFVFAYSLDDKGFATSDRNGFWTITNLKSGTYTLIAIAEGYKVPKPIEAYVKGTQTGINFALTSGDLRFGFKVMPTNDGVDVTVKASDKLKEGLFYSFKKDNTERASGTVQSSGENIYILKLSKSQVQVLTVEEITLDVSGTGTNAGYGTDSFVFGMDIEKAENKFSGVSGGNAGLADNSNVEIEAGAIEGTETVELAIGKSKEETVDKNIVSNIYEVSISGANLKAQGKVILALAYDPSRVSNPSLLCVYKKVGQGWKKVGKVIMINLIECTVKVELTKEDIFGTQGLGILQEGIGGSFGVFQGGAMITINPTSGHLGTVITVKGTDFGGTETIQIDFGTTINIKTTNADSQGSFTTTFTANQQTPGTITITATGKTSNKSNYALFYYPKLDVISLFPRSGTNTGTISATITGSNFFGTPTAKIGIITGLVTKAETQTITATFNLLNAKCGLFGLSVTNPDNQKAELADAFYIFAPFNLGSYTLGSGTDIEIGTSGETLSGTGTIAGVSLIIPQNALSSTQTITLSHILNPPPISGFSCDKAIFLGPHGLYLDKPATLTVPISEPNKTVVYINYGGNEYEPVGNFTKGTNTITIPIRHFSFYFFGIPTFASHNKSAIVYPNPYKEKDAKQGGGFVYFTQISNGAIIKIYNIAGEEIKKIDVDEPIEKWDVKNIASGVYIYTITGGGGGKKIGKIGIIK